MIWVVTSSCSRAERVSDSKHGLSFVGFVVHAPLPCHVLVCTVKWLVEVEDRYIFVFLPFSSLTLNEWRKVGIKIKDPGFDLHFNYMNKFN